MNKSDIDEFLDKHVDVNINNEDREHCDKEISKIEIYKALMSMSKNKSPGTDGLSVEFYLHFCEYFGDTFMKPFLMYTSTIC